MKYTLCILILFQSFLASAQQAKVPEWLTKAFNSNKLDKQYIIKPWLKPNFISGDFNGDKLPDVAIQVIEKASNKKGIIIIHQKSNRFFVFGAGTPVGKKDFDATDDLKWMDGWVLYKDKVAYETTFTKEGDILGSKKRLLQNKGLSIWQSQDGSPLAGGIIAWNGVKYIWIHQGE